MSTRDMMKIVWLKAKYGFRTYWIILFAAVFLSIAAVVGLIGSDVRQDYSAIMFTFCTYLYWPLAFNSIISPVERSKCNYLVPRSSKEIKQFILFQTKLKILCPLVINMAYLVISILIADGAAKYSFICFICAGVPFVFILSLTGIGNFYAPKQKRKKRGIAFYIGTVMVGFVLGMVMVVSVWLLLAYQLFWVYLIFGIVINLITFAYFWYSCNRFRKVETTYENINFDDIRLTIQGRQLLS